MSASTADLVTDSIADLNKKPPENGTAPTFISMSMKERLSYIKRLIRLITVEPLIAAYLMSSVLCSPALITLEFEKACRVNLNYSDEICDAVVNGDSSNYTLENNEIQKQISNMHSWQTPIQSVVPLILVLFLGAYSDRHKLRKPFLVLPIFGEFFAVAACILCVIYMKEWPLEAQGVAQTVLPSLFGGPQMITMAAFAYIADVSTLETRTVRIGVLQIVLSVCTPIVQAFSGVLFYKIGYIWMLLIAGGLYLFGFCYGIFVLKEPKAPPDIEKKAFLKDAFDPTHLKATFDLIWKETPGNHRLFIVLLLNLLIQYSATVTGEAGMLFLYFQKLFGWTVVEYSYFSTVATITSLIGTSIGISLFAKVLKMRDLTILLITFSDKIITNLIVGNAKSVPIVYLALAVSLLTGISPIAIRSFGTKIVSEDNLGKMQSLFSVFEAIGQSIGGPLYNSAIYVHSLETFPAAIFYATIIIILLCISQVTGMLIKENRTPRELHETGTIDKPMAMEEIDITHM